MTRIDFHSGVDNTLDYVCRLTRKALKAKSTVVVLADETRLASIDTELWTFSEFDFLPHVRATDSLASKTPIVLACPGEESLIHFQILVNLSGSVPTDFASFERMFEIISNDNEDRDAGRERYRFYQQRGYPLTHFIAGQA